jgi:hypothetical protein
MTGRVWTADDVRALGVRTDLVTAGSVLGLGRTAAHEHARRGTFPVPVLRLGARYVVPVAPLLELLGVPAEHGAATARDTAVTPPRLTCTDSAPSGQPIRGISA